MNSVIDREHATLQYLMFSLGAETFGIAIEQVREIIEYPGLTTIPLTPAFMRGVINLRGAVVPVVDLSVRFGREATAINRRSCVVVIESPADAERRPLGIIIDGVTEVLDIAPQQIEQRPDFGSGLRADFVASVLKRDSGFVLILDLAAVLSFAELENLIAAPVNSAVAPRIAQLSDDAAVFETPAFETQKLETQKLVAANG